MQARTISLDRAWHWKERDVSVALKDEIQLETDTLQVSSSPGEWSPAKSFPSEIHVELIKAGRIPDPFIGFNEHAVQWVGEREWLYCTRFDVQPDDRDKLHALVFEGLDTVCDVYLNGTKILAADNMFRTYTVSLALQTLKDIGNELLLHFRSAKLVAKALEQQFGRVRAGSTNLGDPSRGPELMTCGPYRPIKLISYNVRIDSIHARALVSPAPELVPSLVLDATLSGDLSAVHSVAIVLRHCHDGVLREETVILADTADCSSAEEYHGIINWALGEVVKLWWPVGYGTQRLYDVEVSILDKDGATLDVHTERIGFRRVELIQEPLHEADRHGKGTTFLFEVNGVRMFIGGSNWIPGHSFLTELKPEDYRAWLTLMREGNQNMVRLWGGGVYEPDCFYDICDDFQFACGVYPAHKEFVENVRLEAEDNVRRLRRHPSLALFCGNNEDYQQVLQWGDVPDLPARLIYEDVLPSVVSQLCDPPVPYHPGSPYGGQGWDTSDPTVGDVHQWDIWAGKERPWQEYAFRNGRFVSEFGMPSFPDAKTVDYWLDGNVKERHERRFAIVMNENFRLTSDLETHIYNTQMMQSEAVSLAYRAWRREWRGKGKEYTAGALIWQLNDCWPVISWSIVDFFRRPKPAYYTIARELKPISVGILRTVTQNRDNDRPKQFYEFGAFRSVGANLEVWGANSTLEPRTVRLELRCFDLLSAWTHTEVLDAVLLPNQSTELLSIPCPCPPLPEGQPHAVTPSHSVVVGARLVAPESASGEVLARYADWPQPFRHVDFPDPALHVELAGEKVSVRVEKPLKGLVLTVDTDGDSGNPTRWTDNALDVLPDDPQTVEMRGAGGKYVRLRAAYMGCEHGRVVHEW
ncbi:glycoside hydrolase [Cubamyces sp. BRFM 1775]|nr:glycoside hydrolase [Cubamyces sp. BRFM 1775]